MVPAKSGDYLRIWVSDDLDPSPIELDQRSQGMQYFFSFYVIFLVEAKGAHADSILLLDEPGLHLHGTAQEKIVEFFDTLAKGNQTLYKSVRNAKGYKFLPVEGANVYDILKHQTLVLTQASAKALEGALA